MSKYKGCIMEHHFKRIDEKIDQIKDTNNKQDIILARLELILERNTDSLEEHMKRTEKNEERIELIENRLLKQASVVSFLWKSLTTISIVVGVAVGITRLI